MKRFKLVLEILILLFVKNFTIALPIENSEPTAKKCQVSQEFLTNLKNSIAIAIKGSEDAEIKLNTTGHGDCEDDLKAIVTSLVEIHHETVQIKTGGKTIEEVAELKDTFQKQVEKLTKERDVFELDFKQETLKREGEMYDRIHDLKRKIQDLKQHIREAEEEFYELVIELVAHKIKQDSVTGKELYYASTIPPGKFGKFFRHIVENHDYNTLLESMYLLQYVYDPQDVFYEYMEEFEERPFSVQNENHKMVLTFLCWATNQEDHIQRNIFMGCELYYLYNMTTHFFPTSNDGVQAVKVSEPVLKGMDDTCLVNRVNFYMKEFTMSKNKEKYVSLNKFGKCDAE